MGKDRRIRALRRTKRAEFLGKDGFHPPEAQARIRTLSVEAQGGSVHRWKMVHVRAERRVRQAK